MYKMSKKNFLLHKNFAKFLQILNLHTDFRPREEAVSDSKKESLESLDRPGPANFIRRKTCKLQEFF